MFWWNKKTIANVDRPEPEFTWVLTEARCEEGPDFSRLPLRA